MKIVPEIPFLMELDPTHQPLYADVMFQKAVDDWNLLCLESGEEEKMVEWPVYEEAKGG